MKTKGKQAKAKQSKGKAKGKEEKGADDLRWREQMLIDLNALTQKKKKSDLAPILDLGICWVWTRFLNKQIFNMKPKFLVNTGKEYWQYKWNIVVIVVIIVYGVFHTFFVKFAQDS